ncbi:MAG: hypothetical protein IH600_00030 [Bacteroidetes bacterium]|nr:hypothetical protein [Bacteroidota bacterium]
MAQRKRIDIFFILYLTAILGFVVVSRERDRIDEGMHALNEQIVRTFVPPVPLRAESDTLRWYVDADSNGIVVGSPRTFRTKVFVSDITPDDAVSLTLHSVLHDGRLTTPDIVALGSRSATGDIADKTVFFPVAGRFPRTGTYHVNVTARTRRVQETSSGVFVYRDTEFDTTQVTREMISSIEQAGLTLTVVVEDTSLDRPTSLQGLKISAERTDIASAVGFEEQNALTVNLGWASPSVTIIRGGGQLRPVRRNEHSVEYIWSGTVSSLPDTVEIEAHAARGAGGKDIARVMFPVVGVQPFLRMAPPELAYAGEDINFDIGVEGLDDAQRYSWRLFEEVGSGDPSLKMEGRGSRVSYRIPNSYADKRLLVEARYSGRPYRFISRTSYASGSSLFAIPVLKPPTRIEIQLPARAPASSSFRFSVSKYSDSRFRGEQPVDRLVDVHVELINENGDNLATDVWMVRKGEFEFSLENRASVRKGGERVIIRILAGESAEQRSIQLY